MDFELDKWQKEVLEHQGNLCLRSGRQVGKSTVISIKAGEYAMNNPNKSIMVVAKVERQALLLFEKILSYIFNKNKLAIKKGKDRPTKHRLVLKNGSVIHCLPVGESGYGVRGFTIDLLIADEAAFIPEDVWAAITPMLATTGGDIWLLSTPFGRRGYFYDSFSDPKYKKFHLSNPEVAEKRPEPMRTRMLEHTAEEKKRMSKMQFAQEYLGEFVDELRQLFPDDVIRARMTIKEHKPTKTCFLGVDIARTGGDDTVFASIEQRKGKLINYDIQIFKENKITDTVREIVAKNRTENYKKIYIDDGGMGVGVFDMLSENPETKRKVVGINNARRAIDRDERRKKLMKEDLYNNLLRLMENGEIELLDREEVFHSLKSVQYEYPTEDKDKKTRPTTMRIFGNDTHIAEALIRAAWCSKDKHLNISISYIETI